MATKAKILLAVWTAFFVMPLLRSAVFLSSSSSQGGQESALIFLISVPASTLMPLAALISVWRSAGVAITWRLAVSLGAGLACCALFVFGTMLLGLYLPPWLIQSQG